MGRLPHPDGCSSVWRWACVLRFIGVCVSLAAGWFLLFSCCWLWTTHCVRDVLFFLGTPCHVQATGVHPIHEVRVQYMMATPDGLCNLMQRTVVTLDLLALGTSGGVAKSRR